MIVYGKLHASCKISKTVSTTYIVTIYVVETVLTNITKQTKKNIMKLGTRSNHVF